MKIVATNVVTSRPPERQPTATLTARANFIQNTAYDAYSDNVFGFISNKTQSYGLLQH